MADIVLTPAGGNVNPDGKTLLDGVNEVLKKKKLLMGRNELTSLSDSGLQIFIDTAIQSWNEFVDEMYRSARRPIPAELKQGTITLEANIREYSLESDLVQIRYPLLDETNGQEIHEYEGGYIKMKNDQLHPANYTGLPLYASLSPENLKIYLDRIPTSNEHGLTYRYLYDRDVVLTNATDTFPFSDAVFRAAVPAVAEYWSRDRRNKFDEAVFRSSMGRALELLNRKPSRDTWMSDSGHGGLDPYAN